jgi:hypothetical protein
MDKQAYKDLFSEEMTKSSELKHTLDVIWKMVKDNPNNMELGEEVRALYWSEHNTDE